MTNPYRQSSSAGDQLYFEGKPISGHKSAQSDDGVIYDPQTDSVNPAGAALIGSIMKQVEKRTPSVDDIANVICKQISPLLDRIEVLEKALDVRKSDTTAAIQKQIDGFMGADDDGPTLDADQLDRMAEAHIKSMRERGIDR
ncbi:hypothetical protein K3740_08720 [Ruegeria conchae]|uniref:hypothetical protein n=1 Tax=Ruegeria conchae TaxID=981384 RepID=UPI0021A8CB0A|nr:hypothetical protein [Ruegeria conchae]UWR04743.1 hypothetical protein K3740_08720 [Ruegeria conchae]